MKTPTPEEVEREITTLPELDAKALRLRWQQLFKRAPPPRMRAGFLRLAIAYRLQELAFGGLKPEIRRQLQKYAAALKSQKSDMGLGASSATTNVSLFGNQVALSPGTRLMREWNGTTEIVDVADGAFIWQGKSYKTLSAAAGAITGTKWSGPKFFGLLPKAPATARGRPKVVGTSTGRSLVSDAA